MPGYLGRDEQAALVEDIRQVVQAAPLYVPTMPGSGKPMSVRMTNCGSLGWCTDKSAATAIRPRIPMTGDHGRRSRERLLELWREVAGYPHPPEACLVNFYSDTAKMGLHQDRDEQDFRRAGRIRVARRRVPVPRWRNKARRQDAVVPG